MFTQLRYKYPRLLCVQNQTVEQLLSKQLERVWKTSLQTKCKCCLRGTDKKYERPQSDQPLSRPRFQSGCLRKRSKSATEMTNMFGSLYQNTFSVLHIPTTRAVYCLASSCWCGFSSTTGRTTKRDRFVRLKVCKSHYSPCNVMSSQHRPLYEGARSHKMWGLTSLILAGREV